MTIATFFYFVIYSFLGWISETTYCYIRNKKFINRGFLMGPFCPIYGVGAVLIIKFLNGYGANLIYLFFISVVIAAVVEYITSYLLEKIFNLSLWDYSQNKWNLNGRICALNLTLFGLLSVLLIWVVHPVVKKLLLEVPSGVLLAVGSLLIIYFLLDLAITVKALRKIDFAAFECQLKLEELVSLKSKLIEDMQLEYREKFDYRENIYYSHISKLSKRLLKAFPKMKSIKYPEALQQIKKDLIELKNFKNKK